MSELNIDLPVTPNAPTATGGLLLTDVAVAKVRDLRAREGAADDAFLRIWVGSGGCSGQSYEMKFDQERREDDQSFRSEDVEVVVDAKSLEMLGGTTLDYTESLTKEGFKFVNPNASRTCGCGESFGV